MGSKSSGKTVKGTVTFAIFSLSPKPKRYELYEAFLNVSQVTVQVYSIFSHVFSRYTRADQNTGGKLLEFSMKTALHGTSRVSSAISVCIIYQRFTKALLLGAVARLVSRWTIDIQVYITLSCRKQMEGMVY